MSAQGVQRVSEGSGSCTAAAMECGDLDRPAAGFLTPDFMADMAALELAMTAVFGARKPYAERAPLVGDPNDDAPIDWDPDAEHRTLNARGL